jgi:hypothetical protein
MESDAFGSSARIRAPRMVAVRVRAENVADPVRIESRVADVRDYLVRAHTRTDVDQSELRAAVHKIDVTVVRIGQVEAERTRADEVDPLV